MDTSWRHNNKLREFQEWATIANVEQLEESGILELLEKTYSRKVADIFAKVVSSDEYSQSEYYIEYDVSRGPESAEISSFDYPGEYVNLFAERGMTFHTVDTFGNILSKRYLNENLEDIKITESNVIFLGKNRLPIAQANSQEYIDYHSAY